MARTLSSAHEDFPALKRQFQGRPWVFLDGPAGTHVPQAVIDAVSDYYATSNANTHGFFVTSVETDAMISEARRLVAALLGATDTSSISFGANTTTLAFALARALGRRFSPGDEVVISQLDHEANRGPWKTLEERGLVLREIPVHEDATLDMEAAAAIIGDRTRLVAVGLASNAFGTVNDARTLAGLASSNGALSIVDAVHAAPHLPLDVEDLGVDMLLCSAYKFYSPHVGILYARAGLLAELDTDRLITAGQEAPERIETGTLNHAAIAGVAAGIRYLADFGDGGTDRERLVDAMTSIMDHERTLSERCRAALLRIPGVEVYGPGFEGQRAPTLAFNVGSRRADETARLLAERGIAAWSGHFYALRAVERLKLLDRGGVVRVGFFLYSSEIDVDRLVSAVEEIAG